MSPSVDPVGVSQLSAEDSIHGEPNIDQIRMELAEIAKLIGPGESYDMLTEKDLNMTGINMTMSQIRELVPHAFNSDTASQVDDDQTVSVMFSDLFDQLQTGSVEVSIAQLMGEVEDEHRADNFSEIRDDKVSLPLQIVLSSVRPEELSSRTTKVERDPELASMPDVFTLPETADQGVASAIPENRVETETASDRIGGRSSIPFKPSSPGSSDEVQEPEEATESAEQEPEMTVEEAAVQEVNPVSIEESPAEEPVSEDVQEPSLSSGEKVEEVAEEVTEEPPVQEEALEESAVGHVSEQVIEEPADEPVFEIPETPEKALEVSSEDTLSEAAFSGVEIPSSDTAGQGEPLEAAAALPAESEGHPSLEDLAQLMEKAEREAVASEYNPPVEAVPDVAAPETGGEVMIRNLDINRAPAEELVAKLDGVGPRLAVKIVEDREINGPFTDLYDLARVQGIGAKIFESITGLVWREDLCGRREILANILDSSKDSIPDIKGVAKRVSGTKGFDGCVIAHDEGYVLASSWDNEKQEALGAFAPQMFKKVVQYISRLEMGNMDAFTFFLDEFPITLVRHGDIFLAAIHSRNRFSRRHVQIARSLTSELSRRLQRMRDF